MRKHKNRRDKRGGKKKRSASKISLASLEIVEENIAVVTSNDGDNIAIEIEEGLNQSPRHKVESPTTNLGTK